MLDKFAGYKTQIRVLERKLKELDHTKLNPSKVKELTEAIKNLKDLVQEKEQKREERRKAKEEKAKEVEAAPKPEVEDGKVILPKDEFIKEHEHIDELLKPVEEERKEQVEELKEVKEAAPSISPKCAICGVQFKSNAEYQQHKEEAHGHRDYQPMDRDVKKEVVKNVEKNLGPAIISEKEPKAELVKFGLDDKVEPVRGGKSVGRVMRHDDNNPATLVYVYWDEGPLAEKDHFGGYYAKDLKKVEEPKEVKAEGNPPPPDTSIVPPHNAGPEHYCPECKDHQDKHADLKTNYMAMLQDLKDEHKEALDKHDHIWVARLDQKIKELEQKIQEQFGTEKTSNFMGKCDLCHGPVCEKCNQCHKCVKVTGSMGKCAESGTEGLTVIETTPAENSGSDVPEGKDPKDEYSDMWGEPDTRDINSAKGVPGSLFTAETAPAVVEQLKSGIKAPYVNAQVASLGGPENVSVIFTVSADPKESWTNGIYWKILVMVSFIYIMMEM